MMSVSLHLAGNDAIQGCGTGSCKFVIGARASVTRTGAHHFRGVLQQMILLTNAAIFGHFSTDFNRYARFSLPTVPVFNWLLGRSEALFLTGDAGLHSGGGAGFSVPAESYNSIASTFTVAMAVRILPQSSGYLFAKSTSAGSRFFSLYVSSARQHVRMYYRFQGRVTRRDFNYDLSDGQLYRVMLVINEQTARLIVDDIQIGDGVDLGGEVEDCGARSSDCLITIGERPSPTGGRHRLTVLVTDAQLIDGAALTSYPYYAPLPSPF